MDNLEHRSRSNQKSIFMARDANAAELRLDYRDVNFRYREMARIQGARAKLRLGQQLLREDTVS